MVLPAAVVLLLHATLSSSQSDCYVSRDCINGALETGSEKSSCCGAGGGLSFQSSGGPCQECFSESSFLSEGNKFYLGYFGNFEASSFFEINRARIFVNPVNSSQTPFMVNVSGTVRPMMAPAEVGAAADDVSIQSDSIRDRAIVVESNESLSVVGYAEEFSSSDTWKALPCLPLPVENYEYYAISVPIARVPTDYEYEDEGEGEEFEPPVGNSAIVVITSESNTELNITLTQDVSITASDISNQVQNGEFKARMPATIQLPSESQTLYIASPADLTGSRITSNKPITLISGHECGAVPNNLEHCDQLVEQIPPTATWGKSFITAPTATRRAYDLFKAVASRDNTVVSVSCTGGRQFETFFLQKGEFMNVNVSSTTYCYMTSSQPALLVQFSVLNGVDGVSQSDPFMVIVPPIEQYRSSYSLNTFSSSSPRLRNFESNYINILLPADVNPDGLRLNGSSIEAEFTVIPCNSRLGQQSATCGRATQMSIPGGQFTLSHSDPDARLNAVVYLLSYRVATAYFAGMTQFPLALPRISFSGGSVQAFENQTSVNIIFTRSGDMSGAGVFRIRTFQSSALFDEDFENVDRRVEFSANQASISVPISLIDDVFPEDIEEFEVVLASSPGVFIDSPSRAVVTILNDDPELPVMNVSFAGPTIDVVEGVGVVSFRLLKTAGAVGPVSVQITTADSTATADDDYIGINQTIQFEIEEREVIVQTFIIDNFLLEDVEEFLVMITPIVGVFPVAVQNNIAVVSITDNDVAIIGFTQCVYTMDEGTNNTIAIEVLEGILGTDIHLRLSSSDGTAEGGSDYLEVLEILTFDGEVMAGSRFVVVRGDGVVEREESFTLNLELVNTSTNVQVLQSQATIVITDQDVAVIELRDPLGRVVREGAGSARVTVAVTSGELSESVTVRILSANINATAGVDYNATNVTLSLSGMGDMEHLIGVHSDGIVEAGGDEKFMVIISLEGATMEGRIRLGTSSMEITIEDSDVSVPNIGFQDSQYTFCESDGTVNILVESADVIQEATLVDYVIISDTAEVGVDIAAGSESGRGVLRFLPGSTLASIAVAITDDSIAERNETFIIALNNTSTNVTIRDDDAIEVFFEDASYTAREGGQVNIGIGSIGETIQEVCVTVQTEGRTAREIVDFVSLSRRIICFTPTSNNEETVTVDIAVDDISEAAEVFIVQLSLPAQRNEVQVNLARRRIATVTILEDSVLPPLPPQALQCSSTTIAVTCTWEQPSPERVDSYLITWRYTGPCDADSQSFLLDRGARSRTLEGLEEGGNFDIEVTAMNSGDGATSFFQVNTQNSAPSGVPLSVRVERLGTDNNIRLRWSPVNCLDANGEITQYTVRYASQDGPENTTSTSDTSLIISGLLSGQNYSFQVAAENSAGLGPFSTPVIATTAPVGCASGANCDTNAQCITTRESFLCLCNRGFSGDGITCRDNDECTSGFNNCSCDADCVNTVGSFTCSCREGYTGDGFTCTRINEGPFTVQFNRREYSVIEENTVTLTVTLNREAESDVTVELFVLDITTQGFNDYILSRNVITFVAGESSATVDLATVGGELDTAELNETLAISLTNPSEGLTLGEVNTATITILDNDTPIAEFSPSDYSVIEGDTVELTIVLDIPATYSVFLTLNTEDGLSIAPGDYTSIRTVITFSPGETRLLVPVATIDDSIVESEEDFSAFLTGASSGLNLGAARDALIILADNNDVIRISFVPSTYTVDEDAGPVNLTVGVTEGTLSRDQLIEVFVATRDNTATATEDYQSINLPITLDFQRTLQVIPVAIINDSLLENQEFFTAVLTLGVSDIRPEAIVFENPTATINILDNPVVRFELAPLNTTEGSGPMVATTLSVVNGELRRSVTAAVTAMAGSAQFQRDFTAALSFLPLSQRLPSLTYTLIIIDDDIFEDTESLVLSAVFDDPIFPSLSSSITIFDNDNVSIGFIQPSYTTDENSGLVNVSVEIDGRIDRFIEVAFQTQDGLAIAGMDYVAVSRTITFQPSSNRQQEIIIPISIINDTSTEVSSESFTCILRLLEQNPLIRLARNQITVSIQDDDGIGIGFQRTDYTVSEDAGIVELVIERQFGRPTEPLILTVVTRDGTALGTEDFVGLMQEITLEPQSTTVSFSITILQDEVQEEDESFAVVISAPSSIATISPDTATVTINDVSGCQNGDLRLQGGSSRLNGRVEICMDEVWGTICDNEWDDNDATVVCRQLGFSDQGAQALFRFMFTFPEASDEVPIFLDEVDCDGTELRLEDCDSDPNTEDCLHFLQDVGVECQPLTEL